MESANFTLFSQKAMVKLKKAECVYKLNISKLGKKKVTNAITTTDTEFFVAGGLSSLILRKLLNTKI